MNVSRIQYLCVGEETTDLKPENNEVIKKCKSYKYWGISFNTEETDDAEIKSRIRQKIINSLNGILWSTEIEKQRKIRI